MSISNRITAIQQIALGRAQHIFLTSSNVPSVTVASAAAGFINLNLAFNAIGTTIPGTLVGFPGVPGINADFRQVLNYASSNTRSGYFARIYVIGTLSLTATGNQFTHDAATFPLLRTRYGVSSQPLNLIPFIYLTAATSVTAPAFILKASGGTTGYVAAASNATGASVIGTKTIILPNIATAIDSAYILRLEDGDSGVQDIVQIDVTTASSTGAATVYGMEVLTPNINPLFALSIYDSLLSGPGLQNFNPAVATAGTATSLLAWVGIGNNTALYSGYSVAVRST